MGCVSKDRPGGFGGGFGAVRGARAQQRARYSSLSLLYWYKSTNTDAAHPPRSAAHAQFTCLSLTGTKVHILTQQRATVFVPNSLDTQEPTGKVTIKGAMLASAYLFTVRKKKKPLAFKIRKKKKTRSMPACIVTLPVACLRLSLYGTQHLQYWY